MQHVLTTLPQGSQQQQYCECLYAVHCLTLKNEQERHLLLTSVRTYLSASWRIYAYAYVQEMLLACVKRSHKL